MIWYLFPSSSTQVQIDINTHISVQHPRLFLLLTWETVNEGLPHCFQISAGGLVEPRSPITPSATISGVGWVLNIYLVPSGNFIKICIQNQLENPNYDFISFHDHSWQTSNAALASKAIAFLLFAPIFATFLLGNTDQARCFALAAVDVPPSRLAARSSPS